MTYKKYINALLLFIGLLIMFSIIATLLYYNNLINTQIVKIIEIISLTISSILSGFYIGKNSKNKGYINGLTLSAFITGIMLIFKLIISKKISLLCIIIYILISIIITSSSIFGINKNK